MDKVDVIYPYTVEYYSIVKENEILPFTTMWMNLQGIMLSEICQTEKNKILYIITNRWKLKNKKNERLTKQKPTHIDIDNKFVVISGEKVERRDKTGCGIKRYKLLCIKQINIKDILYSIGKYSHCCVITFNGI